METENTTFAVTLTPELAGQIQTDANEIGLSVEEFLKGLHRMWKTYKQEAERIKGAE